MRLTSSILGEAARRAVDGRVLVAGGIGSNGGPLASAELYDPGSGTWTATGTMVAIRHEGHTTTLLPDGKMLVAGGIGSNGGPLASAELYDPGSGTATGDMDEARAGHTATLLPDGRVLMTGGEGSGSNILASAELYDPGSGN